MPADVAVTLKRTYEQYLALERETGVRHEFLEGEVWAMAGGTTAHARVKTNLARAIAAALDGKPCLALDSDQKIDIVETGLATYPDLSVVCGPLQRSPRDRNAIVNPTLLVEVLSPSTEGHDLGLKRRHYQRLASLRQMLFVWPEERVVELHTRGAAGTWIVREVSSEDPIDLSSIDVSLTHAQIFARLDEVSDETTARG
jgi:Uma2 family endonuclease